jgi:hypothetical protein
MIGLRHATFSLARRGHPHMKRRFSYFNIERDNSYEYAGMSYPSLTKIAKSPVGPALLRATGGGD